MACNPHSLLMDDPCTQFMYDPVTRADVNVCSHPDEDMRGRRILCRKCFPIKYNPVYDVIEVQPPPFTMEDFKDDRYHRSWMKRFRKSKVAS